MVILAVHSTGIVFINKTEEKKNKSVTKIETICISSVTSIEKRIPCGDISEGDRY